VCFVGAGTMGCYNALITARAGYDVVLYDLSQEALEKVPARQAAWGTRLIEEGVVEPSSLEAALSRVALTTDPRTAARDADLLSESVFERLALKREIHRQFDSLLPPHAIMTTNTSTLLLSDIEDAVQRGEQFAAMHFHQGSPLVDLVAGPRTSPETIGILKAFVRRQGQTYVFIKKERPGYIHNALFVSLLANSLIQAVFMNQDYKDVDRAWMGSQNSDAGPFGMMDNVGLNVVWDILMDRIEQAPDLAEPAQAVLEYVQPYLDRGDLGLKSGRGFYSYPDPEYMQPEFLAGKETEGEIGTALSTAFSSTALTLLIEGTADMEDIDRSWMIVHRSKTGPFGLMDHVGLDILKNNLDENLKMAESLTGGSGPAADATAAALGFLDPYIERDDLGIKTGKGFYTYPDPAYALPGFLKFRE